MALAIRRISTSEQNTLALLAELKQQCSLEGEVISPAGQALTEKVFGEALTPKQSVERICQAVQCEGFAAVQRFTEHFDRFALTADNLLVSREELQVAHAQARPELLAAIRHIRQNIILFQTGLLHRDAVCPGTNGHELRLRYRPMHRVGICVPGGAAAYPSTVLMTAIPAQVAGVKEICIVAPPTPFGSNNPDLLATCHELGLREVYRLGGAQGVAALAYGIEGLPKVDMLVGPGNLFVALAKRHVFGHVGIDMIAGPSEVIILADALARPDYIASDLIAQAEHSPGISLLITWQPFLLDAVQEQLEQQLDRLPRGDLARASLERFGALILTRDVQEAIDLTNRLAPEHLEIMTSDAETLAEQVDHAGAVFLGPWSPTAMGDYVAGPSHVLPTGGTARFASGLTANDFLKRTSWIRYNRQTLNRDAAAAMVLAQVEQLTGHAECIALRTVAACQS